ncbi:hypothetical protein JY651_35050 [Pyxidicoccus parkwayensis]|uniref:Lipoprotein n=1 Tax=Pyxidicoccus parkwayensis TaxID=2813578 RepID=A0ABX7NSH1_9BACT|nr:hypothetical protein [Pyxidicoccus parkwaysis]QSQ20437.1 hypothetical protein JY651_35050 [Pyxidicoccus parkwaysis]
MRRILGVMWLGTALLVSCGGGGDDEGSNEPPPRVVCDVTVSGAVTGTPGCADATLVYFGASDDFTLTLETAPGSAPVMIIRPSVNGRPSVGVFDGPSTEMDCGVSVRQGSKAWYAYYEDPRSGASLRGSCKMTLTQVEEYGNSGSVVSYRFQGTLQAHLVGLESSGATGTVDLATTFSF